MAAMSNITVPIAGVNFDWGAKTPGGPEVPARWASLVFDATTRVGDAKLAYKYKRNGADTADQVKIDMLIPLTCNQASCGEMVAAKAVASISITIPDNFTTSQRDWLVDLITGTISTSKVKSAIKVGESFY